MSVHDYSSHYWHWKKSENSVESHPNFQGVTHKPSAVNSTAERAPQILINTKQAEQPGLSHHFRELIFSSPIHTDCKNWVLSFFTEEFMMFKVDSNQNSIILWEPLALLSQPVQAVSPLLLFTRLKVIKVDGGGGWSLKFYLCRQ